VAVIQFTFLTHKYLLLHIIKDEIMKKSIFIFVLLSSFILYSCEKTDLEKEVVKKDPSLKAENYLKASNKTVSVVSWGHNRLDAFGVGADNAIWHNAWNGQAWSGWVSLGGAFTSHPVAVSRGSNRLDVFALGADNAVWHKTWNGQAWVGWESLGGIFTSPPAAVVWGSNRLDVVGRGLNNAYWRKTWNGQAWSTNWEGFTGVFTSPPALVSQGENQYSIFGIGADNALYYNFYSTFGTEPPITSSSFFPLGGILTSPLAVVYLPNTTHLKIFSRGADNAIWQRSNLGRTHSSWVGWESLGGVLTSPPVAVAKDPNQFFVFALGADNAVWHKAYTGQAWSNWQSLGGIFTGPPAVVSWGPGRLDVFGVGLDNALWHNAWNGQAWSGWVSLGGVFID
jgi:hypothetical protein